MTPTQEAIAGFIRWLLKPLSHLMHFVLDRFELPIRSGPNKGRIWKIGSGVIAAWRGNYEPVEVSMFEALIKPGDTVFDLGAHAGYFTLLAAKQVGPTGKVVAVEPHPVTLAALKRNLEINGESKVTVLDKALTNVQDGEVSFSTDVVGFGYGSAVVPEGGAFKVKTATLDALMEQGLPHPDVIKMDVEAQEANVMEGATRILSACRTSWIISMHEHGVAVRTIEALCRSGHDVYDLDGPPKPFGTPQGIDYPPNFWVILAMPSGRKAPLAGNWKP
jgi:FkbM family methyltransferase